MAGYVYKGTIFDAKTPLGPVPRPFDPDLCGTEKGRWQHRRANEKNCEKCRVAYNEGRRKRRVA